ncbi:MAG TPA: hypothetical protein VGC07_03730 [Granulicella sp.]
MKILQAAAFFLLLSGAAYGQIGRPGAPTSSIPPTPMNMPVGVGPGVNRADPSIPPEIRHQLEINRQNESHKKLVDDTERLLALATELKSDMDKTTKDMLSVQVLRKAEEIEKLAHNIKQEMKN